MNVTEQLNVRLQVGEKTALASAAQRAGAA